MTNSQDIKLAIIAAAVNGVLAILTGVYVFLTYQLLRHSRRSQEHNENLMRVQLQSSIFPYLQLRAVQTDAGLELAFYNWGNNPALDLDIWFLVLYDDEDRSAFEHLLKPSKPNKWMADANGYFYVKERMMSPYLPSSHVLRFRPDLPKSDSFHCFYQYRNMNGQNFWGLAWFFLALNSNRSFKLGVVEPESPSSITRVEWTDMEPSFPTDEPFFNTDTFRINFLDGWHVAECWSILSEQGRKSEVEDSGELSQL